MPIPGAASSIDRAVGTRLRALREARGVSVAAAAASVEMTKAAYEAAECGEARLSADAIYRLSKRIGFEMAELYRE